MDAKQHRVKIREYGEQQLEALGFPPKMEFELDDGSVVELIHPWLWDDETQAAYNAANTDTDQAFDRDPNGNLIRPLRVKGKLSEPSNVRVARAVLGKEQHRRFIAGGGKSNQIILAIELMRTRSNKAATNGEAADPKGDA